MLTDGGELVMGEQEKLELLVKLTREALAGPLGFHERTAVEESLEGYEKRLAELVSGGVS